MDERKTVQKVSNEDRYGLCELDMTKPVPRILGLGIKQAEEYKKLCAELYEEKQLLGYESGAGLKV